MCIRFKCLHIFKSLRKVNNLVHLQGKRSKVFWLSPRNLNLWQVENRNSQSWCMSRVVTWSVSHSLLSVSPQLPHLCPVNSSDHATSPCTYIYPVEVFRNICCYLYMLLGSLKSDLSKCTFQKYTVSPWSTYLLLCWPFQDILIPQGCIRAFYMRHNRECAWISCRIWT